YAGDSAKYLQYTYVIHPDNYMMDFDLSAVGMAGIISPVNGTLKLHWDVQGNQQEADPEVTKRYTQLHYGDKNEEQDYWRLEKDHKKDVDKEVQWMAFRQQFFNRTLVAKSTDFSDASYKSKLGDKKDEYIARVNMVF